MTYSFFISAFALGILTTSFTTFELKAIESLSSNYSEESDSHASSNPYPYDDECFFEQKWLNSQEIIKEIKKCTKQDEINTTPTKMHLEPISHQIALDTDLASFPPGTLIFLGSSEKDINVVVMCLQESKCCLMSLSGVNLSNLIDIDFNQFSYQAIYRLPEKAFVDVKKDEAPYEVYLEQPNLDEVFDVSFINEQCFPFVLKPKETNLTLLESKNWFELHQKEIKSILSAQGAVLLRGFPVDKAEDFATIVKAAIGKDLIDYKGEGSRKRIVQGVYTSTEAPPQFKIPLHNELSCTINPVDYICFYCDIAPEPGSGQTLIGRTEDITAAIMKRPHIWNLFNGRLIKYVSRHPPEGNFFTRVNQTHKTWQQAFETQDRSEVERICQHKGYEFKWMGDWIEVTRRVPAILGPDQYFDHPYWFNQAHLYHPNPRIRGGKVNHYLANLLYISPSTRQYDIEFDDGTPITQDIVYEIYDVLDENTIKFNWEKGDVLLLDNRKALHGRAPCAGKRRILATMIQ